MTRLKRLLTTNGFRNGAWMYALQIFNTVVPLLTLPYVTRVLGSGGYGLFSIALNFTSYFQVVVEYGFDMSATRKVAVSSGDKESLSASFSRVLSARIFLFILCCMILGLYCLANAEQIAQVACLVLMMISVLGSCIQQTWVFQGMQDMRFISLATIFGRTISTVLVFAFVRTADDVLIYCFLYSISPVLSGAIGLLVARKRYELKYRWVGFSGIMNELRDGFYVFTTQLSSKVFGSIGLTFLGIVSSPREVGVYAAIQKIPNTLMLAWTPISQVIYPIVSKKMARSVKEGASFIRRIRLAVLVGFGAMAVLISLFSRQIVEIAFGSEYSRHSYYVIPLLAWLVVAINNNFLGVQTLLASGHDKEYSACFQIGVVITLLLNWVLIYSFGGLGAAVAPLASEIMLAVLLAKKVRELRC